MADTEAAKQAIWLQELLGEITEKPCERVKLFVDNKSAIELTKNPVFSWKEQAHTQALSFHSRMRRE